MRVLVIGATGRLGSTLILALLSRGHTPIAVSRSVPSSERYTTIQGSAEDVTFLKSVILEHNIDALIDCAGSPAPVMGGGTSRQGYISAAVANAAVEAGEQRGAIVRGWWVTGLARLDVPGGSRGGEIIRDYTPNWRPEHGLTHATLESISVKSLAWSILCPSLMTPRDAASPRTLTMTPFSPPVPIFIWWLCKTVLTLFTWAKLPEMYRFFGLWPLAWWAKVTREDVADALVRELEKGGVEYVGKKVAITQ